MSTAVFQQGTWPSRELLAPAPAGPGPNDSLVDKLWNCPAAEKLKQKAFESKFIKGVCEGNMSPKFYGKYTVQDAVYCSEAASLWEKMQEHPNADIFLRVVASMIQKSFSREAKSLLDWWQIKHDQNYYGIHLGNAVRQYVQLITDTYKSDTPEYMLLAMYPCLKLWPYLAKKCQENQHPSKTNLYQDWIDGNKHEGRSVNTLAAAIDYYHCVGRLDYNKALNLFLKAMECEIAFFESA